MRCTWSREGIIWNIILDLQGHLIQWWRILPGSFFAHSPSHHLLSHISFLRSLLHQSSSHGGHLMPGALISSGSSQFTSTHQPESRPGPSKNMGLMAKLCPQRLFEKHSLKGQCCHQQSSQSHLTVFYMPIKPEKANKHSQSDPKENR